MRPFQSRKYKITYESSRCSRSFDDVPKATVKSFLARSQITAEHTPKVLVYLNYFFSYTLKTRPI